MRKLALVCATAFVFTSAAAIAASAKLPAYVSAALADKARPEADVKLDEARKPGELIVWAGIKPGQKVADFLPGGGYFTHLFADVVGDKGHVFAVPLSEKGAERVKPVLEAHKNVSTVVAPQGGFPLPEKVDVVWTSLNYHDVHNLKLGDDGMVKFDKAVFDALKPGGEFIVIDHAAAPGSGVRDTNTLHRIDPAVVKQEVEAAGFKLESESKLLANAEDDHTKGVTDTSIRRHTDQFVFKFRKPK
ncbi:MAG: class I SAM-dependent methyltransferase [Proteobacteria bacterium]|nr:class I SAM-dependent methyltransferase [Pseudomonadota bacterium]